MEKIYKRPLINGSGNFILTNNNTYPLKYILSIYDLKTSTVTIMWLINAERHIYFNLYIRVHSYARSFFSRREERSWAVLDPSWRKWNGHHILLRRDTWHREPSLSYEETLELRASWAVVEFASNSTEMKRQQFTSTRGYASVQFLNSYCYLLICSVS